jgi:class 3 adenylate cyclase
MTHLGDAAFDDLRGEHFAGLRDAMTACGDEEVKSTGDGLLVTFASVVDGLAAALPPEREGHSDVPAELADLSATQGHRTGRMTSGRLRR